ncbi:MAG: YitT family protein [Candidatus Coprovivens sp.]
MKFDYRELIDIVQSKNFWPRLLIMIIGVFIMAITYNTFLLHYEIVTGGTSGLAIIINELFNISPALFIFIVELFLLIFSFILLGTKTTGMTIIGSLLYPLFISITSIPCANIATNLEFDSMLIIALICGLLYGLGSGLVYKMGYSTGGSDIIMQILNKYLSISSGIALFISNIAIIIMGAFVFGINKAIYGIIIIVINSVIVDKIMLGISNSKVFYITTNKPDEIKGLINTMKTGYTLLKAEGGYTKNKRDVIMCVLNTKDYYMFKNVVQQIDPEAFIIITDCYEVYGGKRKETFPFL